MDLDKDQRKQLYDALLSAFANMNALTIFVDQGLGGNLDEISGDDSRSTAVFELIRWAESQGRIEELINAAHDRVPNNARLSAVATAFGLAAVIPPKDKLSVEHIVNQAAHFLNLDAWLAQMNEVIPAVCRVEIPPGVAEGTGFLLGPTTVITNYHVVKDVIAGTRPPDQVLLRFDYKTSAAGVSGRPGQTYKLAARWLLDSSPEDELDYALLSVDGRPGDDPIGGQLGAPTRKWITPQPLEFTNTQPLFVIQHPAGRPLEIAFGSVINVETSRITYNTNTLPGSSGSPCFTDQLIVGALHRAGAPAFNQGVPFKAILARPAVHAALGT